MSGEKSFEEGLIIGLREQLVSIKGTMDSMDERLRQIESKVTVIYARASLISLAVPTILGIVAKSLGWI